jgi:hypothetical protein
MNRIRLAIPSKVFNTQELINAHEDVILEQVSRRAFDALQFCLGGADGAANFTERGINVNKRQYIRSTMTQRPLSLLTSAALRSSDDNLKYFVDNQTDVNDVMGALGLPGRAALDAYCNTLHQSLGATPRPLYNHCRALTPADLPLRHTAHFSIRRIVRCCFILGFHQAPPE